MGTKLSSLDSLKQMTSNLSKQSMSSMSTMLLRTELMLSWTVAKGAECS